MISNRVDYEEVVHPQDPDLFIRIIKDEFDQQVVQRMAAFHTTLADLEVSVSTGRVVDFRAKQFLHAQPAEGRVPLIYPCHFADGFVHWPHLTTNKPNAIAYCLESENLLVPCGTYVLVKRFSAKEEARRIVAAIYDPDRVGATAVGFENHLNYFHAKGAGLPKELALGLAAFLNSTLVDAFFRQFNGHTQVNATDLRKLKYPSRTQLEALGARLGDRMAAQEELDQLLEEQTQCKSSLVG